MASAAKALVRDHIERRRSERLPLRVTVWVCGRSEKGSFREETVTLSINSHGALMALSANVALGQRLLLMNPQTWDEVEARVSRLAALHDQRTELAVEFAQPAPQFWATGRQRYEPSPTRDTVPNHVLEA
jgi:PilZ domain